MASFAEFIKWPDREEVVLVEFTPSIELAGWTLHSGSAYKIAMPALTETTAVAGGVYRRVVGVRLNATDLTERASIAAVISNASSWFWDATGGFLYVHTTTGSNPDSFTLIQAFVTFYVASKGVALNLTDGNADTGVYYHPWLEGQLPSLSEEREDLLFGLKRVGVGDVTMVNTHGFWNRVVAGNSLYAWKNKRATVLLGGSYNGQALLRSQYQEIVTMLVEDVTADEVTCRFTMKALARQLDRELPITPIFSSAYPNLGDGVEGTRKWLGYGRATIAPDLVDTSGNGVYLVADAAHQTLFAVHNVWAISKTTGVRTLLTLTSHYTVDLTLCTVTIVSATYKWQDYSIEVDVTGKPDGVGGYIQTFGRIVEDLLKTFVGVTAAQLDTASFTQADIDAPEELAFWIKSPRAMSSLIATSQDLPSLGRSVMGTLLQTRAGLWRVEIWDPSYDPLTAVALKRTDFASFQPDPKLQTAYTTARLHYAKNFATDAWTVYEAVDQKKQYLLETDAALPIYTYLRDETDAQILAARYLLLTGAVALEVEFEESGVQLAQSVAGDKVVVTYSPASDVSGVFDEKPFEILRIERTLAPLRLRGRLGDLRGLSDRIGRWTDDTAPDYSAATPTERQKAGYWTDDNGFANPADAASKDVSVWF